MNRFGVADYFASCLFCLPQPVRVPLKHKIKLRFYMHFFKLLQENVFLAIKRRRLSLYITFILDVLATIKSYR